MSRPAEPRALAEAFVAALPETARRAAAADDALEAALRDAIAHFRAAFPAIVLDDATCATALADAAVDEGGNAVSLAALRSADVLLARACALGEPHALAIFERLHLRSVGDFIAHVDRAPAFVDEVTQQLRERLFVGVAGGAPKIHEYRGVGVLGGWVRVAAVRLALNAKRAEKRRREAPSDDAAPSDRDVAPAMAGIDPELPRLKRLLGDDFRGALEDTLTALSPNERTVLRMHYLDGLSIDDLAPLHRVHRATVARWIERARKRVLDETRRRLRERLGIEASRDIDSVLRLVRSELDVSVARLLRDTRG